jgi:hypothetical protein
LEFWEGTGHAKEMWEVIACPVADVAGFLSNPLRCFFGSPEEGTDANSNPFEFFSDSLKDSNGAISGVVTDIIVDTVSTK